MSIENFLSKTSVIGAAGKMGKGIALLLLCKVALLEAEKSKSVGEQGYTLYLVDPNEELLQKTRPFFRKNLRRFAEKNINQLRLFFKERKDLISNQEMIDYFVQGAMDIARWHNEPFHLNNCLLVFEAIVEDVQAKIDLYQELREICPREAKFLTNTSSIPITLLEEQSLNEGKMIGFHFYNPPNIQTLVEVVVPKKKISSDDRLDFVNDLAKFLEKDIVFSKDIAGFIGNGHFIREIFFACQLISELVDEKYSFPQAVFLIDQIVKNYLLRPMGIFQLVDYVGIDICFNIYHIMQKYIPDPNLSIPLIDQLVQKEVLGGQQVNGEQKEGFFSYEKQKIQAVLDMDKGYVSIDRLEKVKRFEYSWKSLIKDPLKEEKIKNHFEMIKKRENKESLLAYRFLKRSQEIAKELLEKKVAKSKEDIEKVLKGGFHHLYSPLELNL